MRFRELFKKKLSHELAKLDAKNNNEALEDIFESE